jgi:hypothetical protein
LNSPRCSSEICLSGLWPRSEIRSRGTFIKWQIHFTCHKFLSKRYLRMWKEIWK